MKRTFAIIAAICCVFTARAQFAQPRLSNLNMSENEARMLEHVQNLSAAQLEGRAAGSEGEKAAAEYMGECFSEYGLDVISGTDGDIFGMKQEKGDTLTSRNVLAYIPGYDKEFKDHYIVIGARLDNLGAVDVNIDGQVRQKVYYGANGNGSGLAILLELGRMLSTNRVLLKRSVILAAFGSSLQGGAGAWYFLNRSFPDVANIDAMINLDMLGTGSNGFYAYTASNADLNTLLTNLQGTLQPVQPKIVAQEPVNSDHRIFYDKEIPAVFFTTGMYPEYNSDRDTASILEYEDMDRELEYLYNFSLALVNGPRPEFKPTEQTRKRHVFDRDVVPYYECDTKPTFLGSSDPAVFMKKWVYAYLKYPQEAVKNGIQGRVLVDFIIDKKGKVKNVQVLKGANPLLDAEAVKVVSASPDWKPGRVRGEKVETELSVYVEFRLEKKK